MTITTTETAATLAATNATNETTAATTTEAPSASVQVMRMGHALSPDVAQFLAAEVATAALRERDRRIAIGAIGALVGVGGVLWSGAELAAGEVGLVLCLGLAWGVRNRALLDRAAHDAAIAPSVLVAAVQQVRRGAGPSTALREAVEAAARVRAVT